MINYLSYVSVTYDRLRLYLLVEPSDFIIDDHCGNCLGNHWGDAHGHGSWPAVIGRSLKKEWRETHGRRRAVGVVGVACLGRVNG